MTTAAASAAAQPARPVETVTEKYARHTRNAVVFIAWIIGIGMAASIIVGVSVAVHISNDNSYNSPSNCSSVGGTNPNC